MRESGEETQGDDGNDPFLNLVFFKHGKKWVDENGAKCNMGFQNCFAKLPRCIRWVIQPFLSCVVQETTPVSKYPHEVPPFPSASNEIRRFAEQLYCQRSQFSDC